MPDWKDYETLELLIAQAACHPDWQLFSAYCKARRDGHVKEVAWNTYRQRLYASAIPKDNEIVFGYLQGGILFLVHQTELLPQ